MAEELISFFSESITFKPKNIRILKKWLIETAKIHSKKVDQISIICCNDSFLHKINVDFLSHDTYTDIITFDYSEEGSVSGELYISYERVKENAKNLKIKTTTELHRVIIHGLLHLCGFHDKTEAQKKQMRQLENEALSTLILPI